MGLGDRLDLHRGAGGRHELAVAGKYLVAGLTKAMLSAHETGRQCPSLLTLVNLLGALGFSWQEFGRVLQAHADAA